MKPQKQVVKESLTPQHTPTPWNLIGGMVGEGAQIIAHNDQHQAIKVALNIRYEDAAFIVRSVNSHEELIATLLKLHPKNSHASNVEHEDWDIESCEVCQAIANAEGVAIAPSVPPEGK